MIVLITTFKIMIVKFVKFLKFTALPVYVVLPLQKLHDKKYKTLIL